MISCINVRSKSKVGEGAKPTKIFCHHFECLYYAYLCKKFVCLFVWGFSPHSRIFYSYGVVTITSEGLQNLTYAQQSWLLSSEGSLVCHTYCDTGHIMIISEDPRHSHLFSSVWQWSYHYLFLGLRSVATEIRSINLPRAGPTL